MSDENWDLFTSFLADSENNWTIASDMDCATARLFVDIAIEAGMPNSAADWLDSHRVGQHPNGGGCTPR
ncbi:hypothetical protein OG563_26665 [Nocardia vinacea]|uniref:Transposase n=1 Tax=Nocardia vinacea TaxID=96468 RepID=A0ABZ1YM30_9NOCA|nr:hypothetical protein [Nocardia vinacea]